MMELKKRDCGIKMRRNAIPIKCVIEIFVMRLQNLHRSLEIAWYIWLSLLYI